MMYTISQIIEYLDFFSSSSSRAQFLLLDAPVSWWFNERFRDTFCSRIGGNCASTMGIHRRSDHALTVSDFLLPGGMSWPRRTSPRSTLGRASLGKWRLSLALFLSISISISLSLVEGGVRCVRWRSLTSFLFVCCCCCFCGYNDLLCSI